jgi:pimeloyl-ACP methyl ester carboxylesterase
MRAYNTNRGFDVFVHACPSGWRRGTIINIPGYGGDVSGYNNKHTVLADWLSHHYGLVTMRMPNVTRQGREEYTTGLLEDAQVAVNIALNTLGLPLYLMGFSAGGYAAAVVGAKNHRVVEKLLLMEPSASESLLNPLPQDILAQFSGEVYIVLGDHGVGRDVGELYYRSFSGASRRELVVIENCDHQFRGTRNGQIMAKAPLWAFMGDETFPSPEGGIVLY